MSQWMFCVCICVRVCARVGVCILCELKSSKREMVTLKHPLTMCFHHVKYAFKVNLHSLPA